MKRTAVLLAAVALIVVVLPGQAAAKTVELRATVSSCEVDNYNSFGPIQMASYTVRYFARSPDPGGVASGRDPIGDGTEVGSEWTRLGEEGIDGIALSAALYVTVTWPDGDTWSDWVGVETAGDCWRRTPDQPIRVFATHPWYLGETFMGYHGINSGSIQFVRRCHSVKVLIWNYHDRYAEVVPTRPGTFVRVLKYGALVDATVGKRC